jgi:hypothetical protein
MCDPPQVFADLNLARRLEHAEAQANASFVEARAAVQPDSGAAWIEVAGAYAMFDGPLSPCTQTFGLGMSEVVTEEHIEQIEEFFRVRGAQAFHEVSPLADPSVPHLLSREYEPFEFTSVMFLPLQNNRKPSAPRNEKIHVRVIRPDEHDLWAQTSVKGWSEFTEFADIIADLASITTVRPDGASFLAELDGEPIATASISISDGVALFAGASTIPEARKQGAQNALLDARLQFGIEAGCDLAMMCAQPGSASQRNAERHGFRIAYTRMKWRKR